MAANEPGQPALTGSHPGVHWTIDMPTPTVALAIGAHPDDVEFGAGGTLAKWAANGCVVHHLVLTDGSKGTWNPDADIEALRVTRQAEQREAAFRLSTGCGWLPPHDYTGTVTFLEQIDGELDSGLAMRGEVARCIRTVRPDVVLGHDPWKRYRLHPDHRHAGLLACEGIVAARDPHFFREQGLAPHRPDTLLLWEADEPDHAEEMFEFLSVKITALEAHQSQFESTMHAVDDDQLGSFRRRLLDRVVGLGEPLGLRGAEVFKRIDDL
ncbi:MAG: family deacetylase [Ilumatobacteraceae bacterium]|nr:family deacetylase [Ilumatobacteraceae bacterium]